MLKANDIRSMTIDEIEAKVESHKKECFSFRVQAKTGKLEKQHRIKELKRDIARLLTIKNEMEAQEKKNR